MTPPPTAGLTAQASGNITGAQQGAPATPEVIASIVTYESQLSFAHVKVPSLRGLSARAPYFHNGIAKDLLDVVRHYEEKLGFVFTPQEERDLVAFMSAL